MPKLAWITDIHLDFVPPDVFDEFADAIFATNVDAILLGGDIGEAPTLLKFLDQLDRALELPLYFVLGNHDYYRGSIAQVRADVARHCQQNPRLRYLTTGGVVALTGQIGLIGHDGWADARAGDYQRSQVMLNDYRLIDELGHFYLDKTGRRAALETLGDRAAAEVRISLSKALEQFEHVIFLTHVPPLREACWHEGRISDDQWAPHFVCQAVGDTILSMMREHSEQRLTVLCGHTHSGGQCQPLPNVEILTGRAEYRRPEIQRVFDF